jgi:ubiquinone biosynthesis protein
MGRFERARRALYVTRVARRSGLLRVLRELGVVGRRPATREGGQEFRRALEELGTTYIKLGQLLSSRPDLSPTSTSRSSASSWTTSRRCRLQRSSV